MLFPLDADCLREAAVAAAASSSSASSVPLVCDYQLRVHARDGHCAPPLPGHVLALSQQSHPHPQPHACMVGTLAQPHHPSPYPSPYPYPCPYACPYMYSHPHSPLPHACPPPLSVVCPAATVQHAQTQSPATAEPPARPPPQPSVAHAPAQGEGEGGAQPTADANSQTVVSVRTAPPRATATATSPAPAPPNPPSTASGNVVTALFDYAAASSVELSLRVGARVRVLSKYSDDWWRGQLLTPEHQPSDSASSQLSAEDALGHASSTVASVGHASSTVASVGHASSAVASLGHASSAVASVGHASSTVVPGGTEVVDVNDAADPRECGAVGYFPGNYVSGLEHVAVPWEHAAGGAHGHASEDDPLQDREYFESYGSLVIHHQMLRDEPRTAAYRSAVRALSPAIRGRAVMDVGCGTAVLACFCALAGAKHVYAVDASDIIRVAAAKVQYRSIVSFCSLL